MIRILFVIISFISVNAFAASDFEKQLDKMAVIDRFAWDGPIFIKEKSLSAVRSLGKIIKESTETVISPYGNKMEIQYINLIFEEGLEVYLRTFGSPTETQIITITVTSSKWPILKELMVGASMGHVREVLGEPNESSNERLIYIGETEKVVFQIKNGQVSMIQFDYYAD